MDAQLLSVLPGALDHWDSCEVGHLRLHVQLGQQVLVLLLAVHQLGLVSSPHLSDVGEPGLERSVVVLLEGCLYASASIMAGHDDVLHLQHLHRVLHHCQEIDVGWRCLVGHIAVHEQLSGLEADDLVGRHSGVRTADPEVLGLLQSEQAGEELRVLLEAFLGPLLVVVDDALDAQRGL